MNGRDPFALHFLVRPVENPRANHVLGFQPVVLGLLSLQEQTILFRRAKSRDVQDG
jgi:hypothetical protein